MSPEHHFTYIIPNNLQLSSEPANVEDEDLRDWGPIESKPLTVHTVRETCYIEAVVSDSDLSPQGMTFYLNRLRFIQPLRTFVNKVVEHGRLRYSFIEEYAEAAPGDAKVMNRD